MDTHGYTDFATAMTRLLGFHLCPRLKDLKQRQLCVPSDMDAPAQIDAVCLDSVDTSQIAAH